jgi:oligopeptidase B
MRPALFAGVIGEAPFVDMLNTMSDPSHPLVPLTYPDWGNPLVDAAVYDYMASYSPYDNVKPQAYPPVLATTSVADDRVGFWEPAKWIAKLRVDDTSHSPKLLRVEMGGHGGASGRLAKLRQAALFYAFAIWSVTRHCA